MQLAFEVFHTPLAIFCVGLSHLFLSMRLNINSNALLPGFHNLNLPPRSDRGRRLEPLL